MSAFAPGRLNGSCIVLRGQIIMVHAADELEEGGWGGGGGG